MKRTIEFDDRLAIVLALRNLRSYIANGMYISPDENVIDTNILAEYYRAKDKEVKKQYEKAMATAVIKTCFDDPDIPAAFKQNVARRMQDEFVQSMQASVVTYNHVCGVYGHPEDPQSRQIMREEAAKYHVARKAAFVVKAKKIVKNIGKRAVTKLAVGTAAFKVTGSPTVATIATTGAILADIFIPKKVKEKVKNHITERVQVIREDLHTVKEIAKEKLNQTEVGRAVVKTVERVHNTFQEFKEDVKTMATNVVNTVSNGAKKLWKWTKSLFA